MRFGKLKLDACRYGWMLHGGPFIGKCFELYGEYSEAEVEVLRAILRPGNVAVDVGANIGDLTIPMSRLVGEKGRVYAVESHLETFQVLNANLALNAITNVKALNCFASDQADPEMSGGEWGEGAFVTPGWTPPVMPLDRLALDNCALIKVDVDGREYDVLRSAERTIERCQPVLYFENDDQSKSERLLGYVMGLGYTVFFHAAPIFREDNYFGNAVNHWAPQIIVSLMMLALPPRLAASITLDLHRVNDPADWWQL